jgi:hypothetical protein
MLQNVVQFKDQLVLRMVQQELPGLPFSAKT